MLQVTKAYLPNKKKFLALADKIWDTHTLANDGPMALKLAERLQQYTGAAHALPCANGTVVLQLALRALGITGEVITTPYSYVATTNAILWEHCKPVFADINESDFNINVNSIGKLISKKTQAILATHVYGRPCDTDAIAALAKKYGLKVIYDGAHAFGSVHQGRSLLTFGDISTCSFHATKLFHCGEGGGVFTNDNQLAAVLAQLRSFGHIHDNYFRAGINARMPELSAALGLCIFDDVEKIIAKRKSVTAAYGERLRDTPKLKTFGQKNQGYNFSYYPVLFSTSGLRNEVQSQLEKQGIFPRRYFYPSLNTLPFIKEKVNCPVSESVAGRVLCLPLSYYTTVKEVNTVCRIINKTI